MLVIRSNDHLHCKMYLNDEKAICECYMQCNKIQLNEFSIWQKILFAQWCCRNGHAICTSELMKFYVWYSANNILQWMAFTSSWAYFFVEIDFKFATLRLVHTLSFMNDHNAHVHRSSKFLSKCFCVIHFEFFFSIQVEKYCYMLNTANGWCIFYRKKKLFSMRATYRRMFCTLKARPKPDDKDMLSARNKHICELYEHSTEHPVLNCGLFLN